MIRKVIAAGVLRPRLTFIPSGGATLAQIRAEEDAIGALLRDDFKAFLRTWNGANLEVVSFLGCSEPGSEIAALREQQEPWASLVGGVVVGGDPSGFVYVQLSDGRILSVDSDGGEQQIVAASFDDFIERLVFGQDADQFAGDEWKNQLTDAGLV